MSTHFFCLRVPLGIYKLWKLQVSFDLTHQTEALDLSLRTIDPSLSEIISSRFPLFVAVTNTYSINRRIDSNLKGSTRSQA